MKAPRACASVARRTNNFINTGKQLTREHNLAVVRRAVGLWTNDSQQLRCDWAELAGGSIFETINALEAAKVLRAGGFVGIDNNEKQITQQQLLRPDLKWLAGDVRHHISWLCHRAEIGVFNFDGYLEVGSREASAFFTSVRPLIQRSVSLFGAFVLFSNNDLDSVSRHPNSRHQGRRELAVRRHTEAVLEHLHGYADRRLLPTFDQLLPPGFEKKVNDSSFEGPLGAYWVYSSGAKLRHRMIELGLVL